MSPKVPSIIIVCKHQEDLNDILTKNKSVIVLYYSYAMPWGKIAEHKMHVCAKALEEGSVTSIAFVLVNYAEFFEAGERVEVGSTATIKYVAYVDGAVRTSTGNSAELEGLVTSLL